MTTEFLANSNTGTVSFRLVLKLDFFFGGGGKGQNIARQDLIKYLYFITAIYLAQYVLSHGFLWIQGIFSFQTARLGKLCTSTGQVESSQ